ncbi:energy-dependent translational throttle protein EttA [Serratia marcescens]|uniref:energy-dependent translational throttle protein EttA n=4 Tax=Serratia TaxID=613 RepID=UPI000F7F9810|nr:energy-dependent translational throttle protein EttA [Serratia marcescens]RTF78772.1 energy-dependent translational throttle protein EttA [Serratia marcescens]RTG61668.1 energy-dependent translational throttle protein EttA [Serratia marcescens]
MATLIAENLAKAYKGRKVVEDVSLKVKSGEIVGLLGPNGAGKTTTFYMVVGIVPRDAGRIVIDEEDISLLPLHARARRGIGYLPQEASIFRRLSVYDNLMAVLEIRPDLTSEQREDRAKELMEEFHISHLRDSLGQALSGGERRRVALCRLLLEKPDMLLLDEPTNHLDAESVAWLERFLHDFEGTVVAITHDRYFLDNVAGWILELDRGEGIPWEGNYSSWLEQKDARLAQEASAEAARRKSIEKELEWVRQGAKGRQSKGKARLARFEELNNTEYQKRNETNELFIPPGARLGDKVVEVSNLRKSYGDRLLIDDLSFSVPKGAIVGIIGPNGAGKSTLFRMMSGQEQPDSGSIVLGDTVKLASVDQFRDNMDGSKTVWEEVSGGQDIMRIGNTEMPSRAYVGRFNFKGVDQGKRVGELSGGERGRLHLAKLLQVGGNVLLLDEPTNDLDIETLRALENALLEFPGCAMVISHDRWFLDRIATHILDYQDEGKVEFFEGNFTEYEEYKKRTLGADALEPHRIKYKKIAK